MDQPYLFGVKEHNFYGDVFSSQERPPAAGSEIPPLSNVESAFITSTRLKKTINVLGTRKENHDRSSSDDGISRSHSAP